MVGRTKVLYMQIASGFYCPHIHPPAYADSPPPKSPHSIYSAAHTGDSLYKTMSGAS